MNGKIICADILLEEPTGKQGLNTIVRLTVKSEDGFVSILDYNLLRLPQLLEKVGVKSFCCLEGTYIKMTDTQVGESTDDIGITSILDSSNDYFPNDNGVYFGSKFI